MLAGPDEDVAEVVEGPGHRAGAPSAAGSPARAAASASARRRGTLPDVPAARRASMAGTTSAAVMVPTSRPSSSATTPRPLGRGQRRVEQGPQGARGRGDGATAVEQVAGHLAIDGGGTHPAHRLALVADARAPRVPDGAHLVGGGAEAHRRLVGQPQLGGRGEGQRAVAPVAADEAGDEVVDGVGEQLGRRGELGQHAADPQDRDLVAELDRLVDVVGDEEDRLAELGLQAEELVLELLAHDRVDGRERLVHEHDRRVGGERPGDADALLLPAGELGRVAPGHGRVEADALDELHRARCGHRACRRRAGAGTVMTLSTTVRCGKRPACWMT